MYSARCNVTDSDTWTPILRFQEERMNTFAAMRETPYIQYRQTDNKTKKVNSDKGKWCKGDMHESGMAQCMLREWHGM